jgi:hypothetical protein
MARGSTFLMVAAFFIGTAGMALAQQLTDAQKSAMRSSCRSDYMSYCSSVTPGGPEALQCLQKNIASLSASCRQAVAAIGGNAAAAPSSEKPTESGWVTPKAAAVTPSATPPTPAATPAPAAPEEPAPAKNAPEDSVTAPPPEAPPPAAPPQAAVPPPVPPPAVNYTPRERLFLLRKACAGEVRRLCAGVAVGGGRIVECLRLNAASLSPPCQNAMAALGR